MYCIGQSFMLARSAHLALFRNYFYTIGIYNIADNKNTKYKMQGALYWYIYIQGWRHSIMLKPKFGLYGRNIGGIWGKPLANSSRGLWDEREGAIYDPGGPGA